MAEKSLLEISAAAANYADWPTLIGRAVDDVSRILQSELHMFQVNVGADLKVRIADTVASLMLAAIVISGAICLLCSSILLLRQWFPWWQAFGIAGIAMLIVGIGCNLAMRNIDRVAPKRSIFYRPSPTKPG